MISDVSKLVNTIYGYTFKVQELSYATSTSNTAAVAAANFISVNTSMAAASITIISAATAGVAAVIAASVAYATTTATTSATAITTFITTATSAFTYNIVDIEEVLVSDTFNSIFFNGCWNRHVDDKATFSTLFRSKSSHHVCARRFHTSKITLRSIENYYSLAE